MNVVVLVVDRLHAGFLGCYGNTWVSTPALDRLSIESFVFDQALAGGPRLSDAYAGYWFARHAAARHDPRAAALAAVMRAAGYRTTLLSDDDRVISLEGADAFEDSVVVEPLDAWQAAAEFEDTHLARYFAAATDTLQSAQRPFLLWLHTRGLGGAWDAPREFRTQYAEEDEAEPPRFVEVPRFTLEADHDPDRLWAIAQAYAGQVSLLDACLGVFVETLRRGPWEDDTLLVVTAPRGFPLGGHGDVGAEHDALYGELLHTPLLMRFPKADSEADAPAGPDSGATAGRVPSGCSSAASNRLGQADRTQALTQPLDLFATLLDVCGIPSPASSLGQSQLPIIRGESQPSEFRDRLCVFAAEGEQAIRTPAWFLRSSPLADAASPHLELFAKPDDRYEFNNVADRCPPIAAGLQEALTAFRETLAADPLARSAPLREELTTPPE